MRWAGWMLLSVLPLHAQGGSDGIEYFEKNIRPLFASHCYACHSSKLDKPMKGLTLDSKAGTLRVIVPGKPDDSLLIAAVKGVNPGLKMPPGKPLDAAEIDALVAWVKMGAPDPRTEPSAPAQSYDWDKAK